MLEKLSKEQKRDEEYFQQQLTHDYQAMAKNKKLKVNLAAWDETLGDSYK